MSPITRLLVLSSYLLLAACAAGQFDETVAEDVLPEGLPPQTVVVLGSSTAAGTGASVPDSSWVGRFRENFLALRPGSRVVNLARGGYTTFHLLDSGDTLGAPAGIRPDTARNVAAAAALRPDVVIVNLPSNDAAAGVAPAVELRNLRRIDSLARATGAEVYLATTQPRNFDDRERRARQAATRDSLLAHYDTRALDFWTDVATDDDRIGPRLDSGDGIHLNDRVHRLLYRRVWAAVVEARQSP